MLNSMSRKGLDLESFHILCLLRKIITHCLEAKIFIDLSFTVNYLGGGGIFQ